MSTPFSNRKKVRGWPRRLRVLEAFRRRHAVPGAELLDGRGRQYVKLWLDPWDRLVPRNPPVWLRRRMLGVLLDLHDEWHRHLTASGAPFYLAVWLLHPRFYRSQLVAAVGDDRDFYTHAFLPDAGAPAHPPRLYEDPAYRLDRLTWTPKIDADYVSQSDLDADPTYARAFERRRARVISGTPMRDGDRLYTVRAGGVWVGQR